MTACRRASSRRSARLPFQGNARLSTWLHRIVVNTALMKLRSRARRPEAIDDLLPQFLEDGHQSDPISEWHMPAEALMMRSELRAQVRACVDQLPELYRTVLLLRDIDGLDTEETAKMVGVPTATVKTRLHRARQALMKLLLEPVISASYRGVPRNGYDFEMPSFFMRLRSVLGCNPSTEAAPRDPSTTPPVLFSTCTM